MRQPNINIFFLLRKLLLRKASLESKSSLDSSPSLVFSSHSSAEGVAVDWVNKKLYWTEKDLNRIHAADLHSNGRSVVVLDGLSKPRAIALDPLHR